MEILQTISLDFGKDTEPITVFAKQGDAETRYIEISLLNKGQKYSLEAGITARLHITKPDGKIVLSDASITSATTIRAELSKQALAAPGIAVAEIGLYKGNALLSSQLFYIRIEKRAYSDDAMESTDEYKCLIDALNEVDPAVKRAESAAAKAEQQAQAAKIATDDANAAAGAATSAASAASQAANSIQSEISRLKQVDRSQDLEIEKLKAAAEGNLYLFKSDSEEAYEKTVPADVMSYATVDKIGGKTLVWNQLASGNVMHNHDFSLEGTTYEIDHYYAYVTMNVSPVKPISGHRYAIFIDASNLSDNINSINVWYGSDADYVRAPNIDGKASIVRIFNVIAKDSIYKLLRVVGEVQEKGTPPTFSGKIDSVQIFDLTLMFGAGNEPATVEEFRAMFPAEYYPYSAPTLQNFSGKAIESRGRNLFDPTVFDGVQGITKSGDEYYGTVGAFYEHFGYSDGFLPLDCAEMPQVITASFTARLDKAADRHYQNLGIGAIYTDGSYEWLTSVPSTITENTVFRKTSNPSKVIKNIILTYGDWTYEITYISNIMITAGSTPEEYVPYRSTSYDTSAIVKKYFPDGMKSAGNVHDEIDFERMVAIQRVGSLVFDGVNTKVAGSDTNYTRADYKYNYAYLNATEQYYKYKGQLTTSIGVAPSLNHGFLRGGCFASTVISLFIPNVAAEGNTQEEYLAAFNEALKKNPVEVNYELKTPIETPITELFEETIEVEPGGALTFKSDKGDDFQVPVPNQETFMIKLPNGGTV